MKKILLTLIISATIGIVHAQNVNIPDAIFKAVLVGNSAINTNGDSEIQVSEAAAFGGTIFCASLGISDLTGIEAFTALTVLNCSSNLITSLDISQNTALTSLNCAGDGYAQGQITSLDVSLNTALTEFYCFENQLDSLNISQNSALTTLWCYENHIDSLNVNQNPALTTLWCSNNQLTSLDLSQNTSLDDLNCAFNQLTYLDVANGNNTNMSNFHANNNPNLFCIDVDDVAWSTNNWTNISAQTYFSTNCQAPPTTYVPDNNFEAYLENNGMGNGIPYDSSVFTSAIDTLTYLDVNNQNIYDLTGIEDFTALTQLWCANNQLTSLDVSNNTALNVVQCQNNILTSLDVSNNTSLTFLYCSGNLLTNLDITNNIALILLTCHSNDLTSLDVSNNTALSALYCQYNQLTSLDLSNNTALTYLDCAGNQLTNLDVSANTALTELYCENNQLTSLDASANTALTTLHCYLNQLTSLDVSGATALTTLDCNFNQLASLDVSNNTALTYLDCAGNQLTSLDMSANIALTTLYCYLNQLTSLDISGATALTILSCNHNQLTSLDLSLQTSLIDLLCHNNQLTFLDVRSGNNTNITQFSFNASNNPNLYCINVDNVAWSTNNWTNIDAWASFSTNCAPVPYDCTDSLEVTDIIIDNSNLTMNIAIYNGYNSYLSMPYVAFTIDANGDTIQQGNMNLFGAINLDTSWYNYSINSAINPSYPLTMYFVYVVSIGGSVTDTCILTYDSTPTVITDINLMGDRKLISIVDVLGRESKETRNEPFFYIFDDGTVEKKIIIE